MKPRYLNNLLLPGIASGSKLKRAHLMNKGKVKINYCVRTTFLGVKTDLFVEAKVIHTDEVLKSNTLPTKCNHVYLGCSDNF